MIPQAGRPGMGLGAPVYVLNQKTKTDRGREARLGNIRAAKAVADVVRTTLGPRSMLKMILDPMGGIVLTNDGNSILREIDVSHPAARSIIDLSRTQDEEVGDGTTSVIILAGEILSISEPLLERKLHPTVIVKAFFLALNDALKVVEKTSFTIDVKDTKQVIKVIKSCLGTKFLSRSSDLLAKLALEAVLCVTTTDGDHKEIDLKRYAKIEKVPGGVLTDSRVLRGVMFNKDIIHSSMRRKIDNPRVLLLDCPVEYRKGESMTSVEVMKDEDWAALLKMEEEEMERMCADILKHKPDVLVTEKGISDYAAHILMKNNVSVIRRLRKTDNNRIARVTGATICHRTDEIRDEDVGTKCGLFVVRKIGDEYFTFMEECEDPKACTILLRGPSKDFLNEVERNLHDAMGVARNIVFDPRLCPGGGAVEMAVSQALMENLGNVEGVLQYPYEALALSLEVIPRTLAQNCGANVVRVITELRSKHTGGANSSWGVNGDTGKLADMKELGVWEPLAVKEQTMKTAVEASAMLLRIDEIVSGIKKRKDGGGDGRPAPPPEEMEGAGGEAM